MEELEVKIGDVTYVPKGLEQTKVIMLNGDECLYEIGKAYLIRTVTMIVLGRVRKITQMGMILDECCWVADTGRYSEALEKGTLNEVEKCPDGKGVHFGGIIDFDLWIHELPKSTK